MKPLLMVLALVAGLAVACGSDDSSNDSVGTAGSTGSAAAIGGAPAGVDAPGATSSHEMSAARLVVTSQITLEVTDLRAAYRQAGDIVRALGGFVAEGRIVSTDETDGEGETASAYVRLRVPSEQHDALLQGLRDASDAVSGEATTTREVTGEYTDLQSRLTNLQRSEAQYQDLLTRAGSIDDVLDVTLRLDQVRGEIEAVQGHINLLGDRSDFATVAVTMTVPAGASGGSSSNLPSPVSVFADAAEGSVTVAHALLNVAAVLLVAVIWLVPVAAAYLLLRRPVSRILAASKARLL